MSLSTCLVALFQLQWNACRRVGGALLGVALWNSTQPFFCTADWQSFFSSAWRLFSKVPMHGLASLFGLPVLAPTPLPGMRVTCGGDTNEKRTEAMFQALEVHIRVQREAEKEE